MSDKKRKWSMIGTENNMNEIDVVGEYIGKYIEKRKLKEKMKWKSTSWDLKKKKRKNVMIKIEFNYELLLNIKNFNGVRNWGLWEKRSVLGNCSWDLNWSESCEETDVTDSSWDLNWSRWCMCERLVWLIPVEISTGVGDVGWDLLWWSCVVIVRKAKMEYVRWSMKMDIDIDEINNEEINIVK